MTELPVSGESPVLRKLINFCLDRSPWLSYHGDSLVFDWAAVLACHRSQATESAALTPAAAGRIVTALTGLLPRLPLLSFATTAAPVNYFQVDERCAGLPLSTHQAPPALLRLLDVWATEVDRFRAVVTQEISRASQYGDDHPYRDGVVLKALAAAELVASTQGFQQTLNVGFNLTSRLCVATADMATFLSGVARSHAYAAPQLSHRRSVWHELQQLCQLRLDLLGQLSTGGQAEQAETIASLARREKTLANLLKGSQPTKYGASSQLGLLTRQPGFALVFADQTTLAFDLSPYAAIGSLLKRSGDALPEVPLPPPAEILATGVRYAMPNPYSMTARHVTPEGVTAARVFAAATDRLQSQLRKVDGPGDVGAEAVVVDAATLAEAAAIDAVLEWAVAEAPLITLLFSGFLATYRHGDGWGLALSPWVVANALSQSVLQAAPLSYMGQTDEVEATGDGDDEREAMGAAGSQAPVSGASVWRAAMELVASGKTSR